MTDAPDMAKPRTLTKGTVGEQLDHIQWNLLPEDIRADPNADWVFSCGAFHEDADNDEPRDLNPNRFAYHAAAKAITSLLQERLPFYAATLFHIGRQWKISESLGKEARQLRDQKNLLASAESLIGFAKQTGLSLSQIQAQATVAAVSNVATEQHDKLLAQARTWWTIWLDEVAELRKLVFSFKEQAPRRAEKIRVTSEPQWLSTFSVFLLFQLRPSRIRFALQDGGVRLRDNAEAWPQSATAFLAGPMLMGIAGLATQYDPQGLQRFFEHWRHEFDTLRWYAHQIEIEPKIRNAEARLRQRYGDRNPFDDFAVGKKAASEQLISLLRENEFVDGVQSQWRKEWKKTLEPYGRFQNFAERPPAREAIDQARIERAVRSVDSTIKEEIDSHYRSPIETFPEFCQRIFEQDWVKRVAYFVFRTGSAASQRNQWALDDFQALLTEVVRNLNATGYTLAVPEETRLRILVTAAQQPQQSWDLDW